MTKKELLEMLSGIDDNTEVYLSTPTHNYWRHELAEPISFVEILPVEKSDYHNGQLCIIPEDRECENEDEVLEVLVIG